MWGCEGPYGTVWGCEGTGTGTGAAGAKRSRSGSGALGAAAGRYVTGAGGAVPTAGPFCSFPSFPPEAERLKREKPR